MSPDLPQALLRELATGASDLSALQNLPVDSLVMEPKFTRKLPNDRFERAATDALILLYTDLELTTIAGTPGQTKAR